MGDPFAAKTAFTTGNADATVVWSPDDEECLKSQGCQSIDKHQICFRTLLWTDLLPGKMYWKRKKTCL